MPPAAPPGPGRPPPPYAGPPYAGPPPPALAGPGRPPGPAPEPAMDALFGSFWPEAGLASNVRAVLASLAVGLLAAIVLPFRDAGVGTFVVLLAAGGVVLGNSLNRRSPFTLACAGLCALLASVAMLRDADWIIALCLLAGGVLCAVGVVDGRTLPAFVTSASPGPSPASGGCRGWVARRARSPATAAAPRPSAPPSGRCSASSCSGCSSPPPTPSSPSGPGGRARPDAGHVRAAGLHHRRRRRRRAGGGLPRAQPTAGRAEERPPAGGAPLRVAGARAARRRRVPGVPRRPGHRRLRGPRLPRAHDRADLRRVRARGVRPAHRGHRPHAARGLGRGPQGASRDDAGPGVAARLARAAVRADARRRRLGALPDARLPGGLRLHPAAAAGRRLRGLARAARARGDGGRCGVRAAWLPRAALLSGAALLLGLAAVNPDAWIAEHNLDRYAESGKVDWTTCRACPTTPYRCWPTCPERTGLRPGRSGLRRRRLAGVEPGAPPGSGRAAGHRCRHLPLPDPDACLER